MRNLYVPIQELLTFKEPAPPVSSSRSLPAAVESLERRMIENALRESAGNKQKAAQTLGLSRQGLIKKWKRLAIEPEQQNEIGRNHRGASHDVK